MTTRAKKKTERMVRIPARMAEFFLKEFEIATINAAKLSAIHGGLAAVGTNLSHEAVTALVRDHVPDAGSSAATVYVTASRSFADAARAMRFHIANA